MEIKSYKDFEKNAAANTLKSPMVIFGEENYLIKQCIKNIYGRVNSFPELNITTLEGENITIDSITNACETMPFMSDIKIVHVKNPDFLRKTNKGSGNEVPKNTGGTGISDLFSDYIKDLPSDIILLVTLVGEIESKNKVSTVIRNLGTSIELNELKGAELQKYVEDILESRGKTISKSDLIYFISEVGTSLEQIASEIEKLCAFGIGEDVIDRNQIDAVVSKSTESNIFKMVDDISRKDASGAISILNTLLFQKEEHLKILGMIIRQYRLLLMIKLNTNNRVPGDSIKSSLKLKDFQFQNMLKQCRMYDEGSLKNALGKCLEVDSDIKTGRFNPELALEMLLVELCK